MPSNAGSSVSAASAETKTTRDPPTAREDNTRSPNNHNPDNPIRTAIAENAMARPAVATVRSTANPTSSTARSSSRKRDTARSA